MSNGWERESSPQEPWLRRFRNCIWGYDFFISYHWDSGGPYAVTLAQRLRDRGFDCFLDRAEYAVGDDWKKEGHRALRNTQRLIVIATREAVTQSEPVAHEVEVFSERSNHIIPIFFGDELADIDAESFPILKRLTGAKLHLSERHERLLKRPSICVVKHLVNTDRILRRRALRARIVTSVIVILFLASFVVGILAYLENQARKGIQLQLLLAKSQRLAALSLSETRGGRWDVGLILAAESYHTKDIPAARGALLEACQQVDRLKVWISGPPTPIRAFALSSSDSLLAAGYQDGTVMLWNLAQIPIRGVKLPGIRSTVTCLAFTPDSRILALGTFDSNFFLYDVATNKYLTVSMRRQFSSEIDRFMKPPEDLSFTSDGKTLIVTHDDESMVYWNVATGAQLRTTEGTPIKAGTTDVISPDGRVRALGHSLGDVMLWRISGSRPEDAAKSTKEWFRQRTTGKGDGTTLPAHRSQVTALRFSSDSSTLASGASDGSIAIHEVLQSVGPPIAEGASEQVLGRTLGNLLTGPPKRVTALAISQHREFVVSAMEDGAIILWDLTKGSYLRSMLGPDSLRRASVTVLPDSRSVLSNSWNGGSAELWDAHTRQRVASSLIDEIKGIATLSSDGTLLAASTENGVKIYRWATGEFLGELNNMAGGKPIVALKFSPNGSRLVSAALSDGGNADNMFDLDVVDWDVSRLSLRGRVPAEETRKTWAGSLGPDGHTLALARADGSILLWDLDSQKPHFRLEGGRERVYVSAAFTPDGRALICGDNDGSVTVWNLVTQRLQAEFRQRFGKGWTTVAISPDGQILGVGAAGKISLFDLPSKLPLGQPFEVHDQGWVDLSFSPNGQWIASGGDGPISTCIIDPVHLLNRASAVANRNFSNAEWEQYLGSEVPYRKTFQELPEGEDTSVGVPK